jgi:SAM-dependent methyltransferase
MQHVNLTAYDNVELLTHYTQHDFEKYCQAKLESCDKHISFIRGHCVDDAWQGRVCEIGSGNSKLLYRLELEGLLEFGTGFEISHSRHTFAEKFRALIGSQKVHNQQENVMDVAPVKEMDLIIGVDNILNLIAPLHPTAEQNILSWIRKGLRTNGYLILELWDFVHILKLIELSDNQQLKIWGEFPQPDQFEFGMYQVSLNENQYVVWKKMYLKRNSTERSHFENILKPYTHEKIIKVLKTAGFKHIRIFPKWNPEEEQVKGEYVVLAKKEELKI